MSFIQSHSPLLRAVGVLSAIGVLVTGVTFASLQSQQATLAGNTIQSATADLRIGTSASTFAVSRSGFTFQDVVPGGPAMPTDGYSFYLKNYGSAVLALKVVVGSTPTTTNAVDLSKVKLQLTREGSDTPQVVSLQTLTSTGLPITDSINGGAIVQYRLRALMDADAFNGSGASVGAIDLVFSGTAVN